MQISKNRELVKYTVAHLSDGIKRKINTLNTHTYIHMYCDDNFRKYACKKCKVHRYIYTKTYY